MANRLNGQEQLTPAATTDRRNSTVDNIRQNLPRDWEFLNSVYKLLKEEKACYLNAAERSEERLVHYVEPEELKKLIDLHVEEHTPQHQTLDEIEQLCRSVIKYSVKTNHGRFHNQLFGQIDPIGLAGTWISEALNTSAYTFEVAPVFSLIETEILQSIIRLSGYGSGDGIYSPGGSMSNMYGMSLARYKRYPQVKTGGMCSLPRPLVLFTSDESHYSFKKAAHLLGFGMDNCVVVKSDATGRMLPADLEIQIERVKADGREPFFVNATAGTTVLGAFDDFEALADICKKYDLWLHIDACLGGSLLYSHEHRHLLRGLERSNSFAWNPHKTLGVPLQCSLFLTREQELLTQCNSLEVNYLFQQDKFYDVSYDTGNKSVQCGRKVDAFKFWLMLKARGYGNFGHLLDHAMAMARLFAQKIRQRVDHGFRLVVDEFQYTNVCFWFIPAAMRGQTEDDAWWSLLSAVAPKIKERMAHSGFLMIGYTPLQHRSVGNFFRMVFTCFPIAEEQDLDFILDEVERLGSQCSF